MKRVILSATKTIKGSQNYQDSTYVDCLLENMSEMSTSEIHRNKDAIDYCQYLMDQVSGYMSLISKDGWDDTSAEINKRNGVDLVFQTRGTVYTSNKKTVNMLCNKLEMFMKENTPFNDVVDTSYFVDTTSGVRGYVVVVSAEKYMEDDKWW